MRLDFFLNVTPSTDIYTLSLHDALPILGPASDRFQERLVDGYTERPGQWTRSEEHTSELQSHHDLVCRLLLEKKKTRERPANDAYLNGKVVDELPAEPVTEQPRPGTDAD